jgi:hypothetical protein
MAYIFSIILIFLYPYLLFADALFDSENFQVIQKQNIGAAILDFNGDGFDDLFLFDYYPMENICLFRLNKKGIISGGRYYDVRGGTFARIEYIDTNFIFDVLPPASSSDAREGLLLLCRNWMYLIRYYDYGDSLPFDADTFSYNLSLGEYAQILALSIGDFFGGDGQMDLAVVASNGVENRIFFFAAPFATYYLIGHPPAETTPPVLIPDCIFPFPRLDSKVFSLNLASARKGLFFQSEGRWYFWMFGDIASYKSLEDIDKIAVDIPNGVVRPLDVIKSDFKEYPLLISVESSPGGDVAYLAYRPGNGDGSQIDFINPVPVSIQNKSEINPVSRLFLYENKHTSHNFPLLIISGNTINESAGGQTIYCYAIDETTAIKPVLTQIVVPSSNELIYPEVPLEPVSLFQFDGDGVADLLLTDWKMMYYYLPGLNPESAISPLEWPLLK